MPFCPIYWIQSNGFHLVAKFRSTKFLLIPFRNVQILIYNFKLKNTFFSNFQEGYLLSISKRDDFISATQFDTSRQIVWYYHEGIIRIDNLEIKFQMTHICGSPWGCRWVYNVDSTYNLCRQAGRLIYSGLFKLLAAEGEMIKENCFNFFANNI